MQRQHESEREQSEERPKARHKKRSLGELLVAWLVLLWGGGITVLAGWIFHEEFQGNWSDLPTFLGLLFHGLCCLGAGVGTLMRHRPIAKWLLFLAGLCVVAVAAIGTWQDHASGKPLLAVGELIAIGICVTLAIGFVFLGRWLGRQEDIAE